MPGEHMVARGADRGLRGVGGGETTAMPPGWDDLDEWTVDDVRYETEFAAAGGPPDRPHCATCDTPLGDDPDDDPTGDAGLPICGECDRARSFDTLHRFPPGG
jgi:hypothetical protein